MLGTSLVNAGTYRFPATLHRKVSQGDFRRGRESEQLRTLWVDLKPKSAAENSGAEMTNAVRQFEIRTPWTPDKLDSSMWIEARGRRFDIDGVIDVDEASIEYLITATERA